MKTIHAVFENGVFRPTQKVELPEHCEVEFEPRVIESSIAERIVAIRETDPKLAANATTIVTVMPLFAYPPAVHQLAEERLVLAQASWWRAIAYFALGSAALSLLFFLCDGLITGGWDSTWVWMGGSLVLFWSGLAWRAARTMTIDRRDRTLTTKLSMNRRSVTRRPLADLSAVQVITYSRPWAVHQVRLVFAESEPRIIALTNSFWHGQATDLARRLSDFLGVPLLEQKW
jgi:predicted DNA-binding antitoxin AbrB/MazE fold protein